MVCICSRRISGYSVEKTNSYDIDDFINQLLSSQKFDELADKVAEKAVKKLKNIGSGDHLVDKITVAKHSSELGEIERQKFRIHESNEGEGRKKVENYYNLEGRLKKIHNDEEKERVEERSHKDGGDKQVKINTQALMKKEHDSGDGELSLKYRYLKKHARDEREHNHQTADSSERNPWTHLEHSKPKAQYFVPVIDDKEHTEQTHHNMNSDSIENGYIKRNKKSNSQHVRYKNERDEIKDDDFISRPQFKAQQVPNLSVADGHNVEKENNKTEHLESLKHSHENVDAVEENKLKRTPKREIVWRAQHSDSDKSENDEEVKFVKSTSGVAGYELGELTTKRVIRREGDRFYTYLSGAEYADFHEEIAKQQKGHARY